MKRILLLVISLIQLSTARAQVPVSKPARLSVFVDCSNTWCDMTYIRSEINLVDFSLDNQLADVHVLITSQINGSGGEQFQLIFYGQKEFRDLSDTLRFDLDPNATDFERREALIKPFKLGLLPFILRTQAARDITVSLKKSGTDSSQDAPEKATRDPWNYWVFRVGTNGNINGDAVYYNQRFSGNLSANRTTDKTKFNFNFNVSANKSSFEFDNGGVMQKFVVNNHDWSLYSGYVHSINDHWSWGIEGSQSQNTFSNLRGRTFFRTAVEYNFFRYQDVNNKLLTISYGPTLRRHRYYDTTIYDKTKEMLAGHQADAILNFNQKWGNASVGINYHHYFRDWDLFNLGIMGSINVRITGGLSFYVSVFGGLTRDQVFLQKGTASTEEVLARQRQLASGYNFFSSFGINYRFGSLLNNFVNPRFEGGGGNFFF